MSRNYSPRTLKILFALSGNQCAFPDCKENIVDTNQTMLGEICHIEDANPGCRYNPNQTDEERHSVGNLILLCSKHHKVTNNQIIYPVKVLKEMKASHESRFVNNEYSVADEIILTIKKEGLNDKDFEKLKRLLKGFRSQSASEFEGEYCSQKSISYRHLTGINEYPTLSFLEPIIPKKVTTILGINNTPIIHTDNPVFRNIERFSKESVNEKLISDKYHQPHPENGPNISYTINQAGFTKEGEERWLDETEESTYNAFNQSREYFENDNLKYDPRNQEFEYAPILMPFQAFFENSEWTSIVLETNSGRLIQAPRFSEIKTMAIKDEIKLDFHSNLKETWIRKVIENNPSIRGFILYIYQYLEDLSNGYFSICGIDDLVVRLTPAPYIRFVDIENTQNYSINLKNITYKFLDKFFYHLTEIDNRRRLFENLPLKTEDMEIILPSKQHLLIPIEFGFDTRAYKKGYIPGTNINSTDITRLSSKILHISKLPNLLLSDRHLSQTSFSQQEENKLFSEPHKIPREFLENTKELEELFESIPNRFSLGSVMDIVSIKIEGKEVEIKSPHDNPKFSMSVYFAYGSCPYLLVYNPQKGYWIEVGTVLYGKQKKSLQQYEIHKLDEKISKIRLEERDKEITYIKFLSILYTEPKTKITREAVPSLTELEELTSQDGSYFLLRQGESIEINLENLIPEDASNVKLKINGYYEVLP